MDRLSFPTRNDRPMHGDVHLLDEADVLAGSANALVAAGWTVVELRGTTKRGVDLIATRGDVTLEVEAKGATSSKPATAGYGRWMGSSEIHMHVDQAVCTAIEARGDGTNDAIQAVAFPDDRWHRRYAEGLVWALDALGVAVFWITPDGTVSPGGTVGVELLAPPN